MYDGGKIVTGLIVFLVLLLFPLWYQLGKAEKAHIPQLSEIAKKAEQCVEPKSFMTTQHMKLLDQWRNETVRGGERYYRNSSGKVYYKSLQVTCMECHDNKSKFCDQCHNYVGVDPFCWDCHVEPKE